jgi:hypothetical protein
VIHHPDSLLAGPPTREFSQELLRDSATHFLYARGRRARRAAVARHRTPLASSESLYVVSIVTIDITASNVEDACCTE